MTTLYVFHPLIEASETANTVVSVFGQWWDGDAGGGGGTVSPDLLHSNLLQSHLLTGLAR